MQNITEIETIENFLRFHLSFFLDKKETTRPNVPFGTGGKIKAA